MSGIKRQLAPRIHESPMRDLLLKHGVAAGPVSTLFMAVHPRLQFIFPARARSAFPFVAFLFSPTRLCSLISWILTPETRRKKAAQKEDGGVRRGKEKREKAVEISRRHHSLPPRRLSVSPPSLWPYKAAFHPHSWWRKRDAMRPAESRAKLDRGSRRDSQDRALIGEHELGEQEGAKGRKQDAFFGRARARRHYSHEDRKHRGARREGWDPWIIARSYFFFLYIVLYLGACTHTESRAGYYARR